MRVKSQLGMQLDKDTFALAMAFVACFLSFAAVFLCVLVLWSLDQLDLAPKDTPLSIFEWFLLTVASCFILPLFRRAWTLIKKIVLMNEGSTLFYGIFCTSLAFMLFCLIGAFMPSLMLFVYLFAFSVFINSFVTAGMSFVCVCLKYPDETPRF